jgi:hypothetical protein
LRKVSKELITSSITVILAIFAIALFISSGGTLFFYGAVGLAIIFGLYNAWLISALETPGSKPTPKGKPKRRKR